MRLAFDIEANGLLDTVDTIWCIVCKDLDSGKVYSFDYDQVDEGVNFLSNATTLMGWNIIQYDLPLLDMLYGRKPNERTEIVDGVILSRLYKPDRSLPPLCPGNVAPHSIEAWGYRVGRGKPSHDDWSSYSRDMLHRCQEDTEIACLAYKELLNERGIFFCTSASTCSFHSYHPWTDSERTEHKIARAIAHQERTGCPLDINRVRRLLESTGRVLLEIDRTIVPLMPEVPLPKSKQPKWPKKQFKKDGDPTVQAIKYYGEGHSEYRTDVLVRTAPINLASDKQIKQYLLSVGWEPTEWNFKKDPATGKPMRDSQGQRILTSPKITLDSMDSIDWVPGHEEIGKQVVRRLMVSHRHSMLKGWLRDVRPDGRISAEAIPLGTPTGRMIHRKVVNVPGGKSPMGLTLRSCFGTIPGYTRVGIDLVSCQVYALCHYMPDEKYREAVRTGDPHVYVQELAGLATRDEGKKLHYSTLFGAGPPKISSDLGLSQTEAKLVIKRFFKNLPELDKLLKNLEAEWRRNDGWIEGLDGRKVWVRAKHMLLNYLLQSFEAVIMKNFINRLLLITQTWGEDALLITTMHDESQFLVEDSRVERFKDGANVAIDYVNEKFNIQFPQALDIKEGITWADCH